ncbi:MAG: hypothetical protein IJ863_08270, partial [Spirochaetales bacterium]|nr:hypothetical protein [Spirochaetales bacterium]
MKRTVAFLTIVLLGMACVFAQSIYETNDAGERTLLSDAVTPTFQPMVQETPAETVVGVASAEITVVVTEEQALASRIAAEEEAAGGAASHVLEGSALEAFAAGSKADGDTTEVDGFFTVIWSAKSKVDSSKKTWEDGYYSEQRINLGGKFATKKNSIRFTVDGPSVVKVWWVQGGEDNREVGIFDADGSLVVSTSGTYTKNSPYYTELSIDAAGTY